MHSVTTHPVPLSPTPALPAPAEGIIDEARPSGVEEMLRDLHQEEEGLATAEYGIVMLAAVGFAGLLVVVLSSGEVREMLAGIVQRALTL
ncbi:DUF4244 domain-containing protein [Nesterenkonia sp. HG001]|uniref:DUF4244 domain-containing protein n=1 Tax=Nesterenkonia sp. HG001 TaxID=2983207 RepID=UPI002AC790E5|nr:DUF4244 domain-containing protein [Nesterenkonia sp. HG001]MDZ5077052.1 DUF4244 domain-containing protein [Nesterenkonia sp. HG001]